MRERVKVDRVVRDAEWMRAHITGDDLGVTQVRRLFHAARELGGELAEAEVLGVLVHQMERRGVPEAGGAAVAEQHFVAVGKVEQSLQTVAHFADLVAHRGLSMRRAHVGRRVGEERVELVGADLGRSRTESTISREKVRRYS